MNKNLLSAAILGTLLSLTSATALAKLDASEIARLGQDLTPTGAEQAGNADGSIPAWSGGLTQPPAGYSAAKGYIDPFANEQPLYTVTAANMAQYADRLMPGYKALLAKFPSYKLNVYPSHRTAALPQHEYELIREEAAKLELNGDSMVNYQKTSVPFPIPKSGLEAMWNHLTRYRTGGFLDYPTEMVVQANGSFTPVRRMRKFAMASSMTNPEPNRLYYFWNSVTSPERAVAGAECNTVIELKQAQHDAFPPLLS